MFNKYIKYGNYKVRTKIRKKIIFDIYDLIKENTKINNNNDGSVKFILKNIDKILLYEINNITNIGKITNYKYTVKELIELKDDDINKCLDILTNLNKQMLERYKNIIINKVDDIGKKIKQINEIQEVKES